jgi:hypothetical protein
LEPAFPQGHAAGPSGDPRKRLIDMQKLFLSAVFLPNEDLDINGKHVNCRVIKAPRKELPGLSSEIVTQVTFWVEKRGCDPENS